MEPILNTEDVAIPPNGHTGVIIQTQTYSENAVTKFPQPSDILHDEGDVIFCTAVVTLSEWMVKSHVNSSAIDMYFHHPCKIAICSHFLRLYG